MTEEKPVAWQETWEKALEDTPFDAPEPSPHPLEAFFSESNLLSLIPFVIVVSIVLGIIVQAIVVVK